MAAPTDSSGELAPSKLGTIDHWNSTYEVELRNFEEIGDIGEVWFGEDSQDRMVRWLTRCEEKGDINKDDAILDLGCGNGALLVELAKEDFTCLYGVDYSPGAIELSKKVALSEKTTDIVFEVGDILKDPDIKTDPQCLLRTYRIVVDKGTYDAISLSPENRKECREKYIVSVIRLLQGAGLLVLTSCNWTKEELLSHFGRYFELIGQIPTPQFTFGGQTGNNITQVIFKKKS